MSGLSARYRLPLALLTDLYQLTMAHGYWKSGMPDREAVFHLFFRNHPFQGGYTIAAGLGAVVEYLREFRFDEADLAYLAELRGNDGQPLFATGFVDSLAELKLCCDIDAVPEGTVVFPYEPLVRVRGPLIQAQILETALLNLINFPTLVATKAARVVGAACGDPVLEFGLRRAQGIDGALTASRAAYLGGCAATSNVLAGRLFGIPVKGTHAHSWVMCFDDELEAFRTYAEVMPNNCVFLVDTYDTLEGVRQAIEVGRWLRQQGHEMVGIRLDSGDLAYLSIEARKLLDTAGFSGVAIVASNDLDEHLITALKDQGATIGVWGVGTKLVTAYDQPALGGVYKLSAIRDPDGVWQNRVKLSEQVGKISNPGILQVRRYYDDHQARGDMIVDEQCAPKGECAMVDPFDSTRQKKFAADTRYSELLVPVFRQGECIYRVPSLEESRQRTQEQLAMFHGGVKRLVNPHAYPVGLEEQLFEQKTELLRRARTGIG